MKKYLEGIVVGICSKLVLFKTLNGRLVLPPAMNISKTIQNYPQNGVTSVQTSVIQQKLSILDHFRAVSLFVTVHTVGIIFCFVAYTHSWHPNSRSMLHDHPVAALA